MSQNLPKSASILIIGAGIVGSSVAWSLMKRGRTDIVVVEQGPLPEAGGSTSHAPGLMFSTSSSRAMTILARRSMDLYESLRDAEGACYHRVGSIEIATTPERKYDLHRKLSWAHAWGNEEARLIAADEAAALIPLLDATSVRNALHVPYDGLAKAVRACDVMAKEVLAAGAGLFFGNVEVSGFDISRGHVRSVHTSQGTINAEMVLICTGIWGPCLGKMAGIPIPLIPVQHQYSRTSPLPQLAGESREIVHPLLRHQDADLYYRQHFDCYGVGSYDHEPQLVEAEDIGRPGGPLQPSKRPFTSGDFEAAWRESQRILPALRDARMEQPFNGMFSFTPDGMPLLGESRVKGLWVAEAVWVTHGGGVGQLVADWICDGSPAFDTHEMNLHRFEPHTISRSYVRARGAQQYREVYDIIHPAQQMEEPRLLRLTPFYARQGELGGQFREARGWERPHWFTSNSHLPVPDKTGRRDEWAARYWSPIIAAESVAVRAKGGLFDMTSLPKLTVSGSGALGLLQKLTTGNLDRAPGSVTYTLLLNEQGGIVSDVTVARVDETTFQIGCNGVQDAAWLRSFAPDDGSVRVEIVTDNQCCIGLWGPIAREVIEEASGEDWSDVSLKYFKCQQTYIAEVPVLALRVSYVGELGYELYAPMPYGARLWSLLEKAGRERGLIAAGRGAFDSLRLEKGYRLWGADMTNEHTPDETGLNFAVKMDKGDFFGKEALLRRRETGFAKNLRALTIDEDDVVMGKECVFVNDEPVGYVTSADFGYNTGCSIAYAHLPIDLQTGTRVTIGYFDRQLTAVISEEPLYDPRGQRLRG